MKTLLPFIFLFLQLPLFAKDLGFRFKDGRCVDAKGVQGLNPSFFGPCADLRNTSLAGLDFSGIDFSGSNFENAILQRTVLAKQI